MKQSGVRNRLCWTILFIFVYVLGSKITLPFVDLAKVLNVNEGTARGLELTSAIMGGNLRGLSIFRAFALDVFNDLVAVVYSI